MGYRFLSGQDSGYNGRGQFLGEHPFLGEEGKKKGQGGDINGDKKYGSLHWKGDILHFGGPTQMFTHLMTKSAIMQCRTERPRSFWNGVIFVRYLREIPGESANWEDDP